MMRLQDSSADGSPLSPPPQPQTQPPHQQASSSTRPSNPAKPQRTTADYSLSCAECRRLKLKCSRVQWPCETCVKRGIPHLCPDGIQKKEKTKVQGAAPPSKPFPPTAASESSTGESRESLLVWSRLEGLERKLDMLIESSSSNHGPRRANRSAALDSNGSLHDFANIATDQYAMESGRGGTRKEASLDTARQQPGTLTLHPDGRAHYMGSNAHSMYLARENLQEDSDSRRVSFREEYLSRPGSPTPVDLEAAARVGNEAVPASPTLEGHTPSTIESQPPQLVWATPGFRSPHSSTAIWNYLKSTMPVRETAQRMVDVYYSMVTFMFHPIPRKEFDKTVWSTFYSHSTSLTSAPPPNFHPHKLALLYSMLSLGVLLDVQRPQRDPVGRALYSCAWNALALSNFTEATSLEAILALMHINMYLTWRRGGRYAESAYPLLGTMMRMTISTGLHRDPSLFHLGEEERERRRRVFWDVQCAEVFRAFAFCRPPALCDRHVDTRLPSLWRLEEQEGEGIVGAMPLSPTRREGIFHAFKCKQVQITNRMLDECLCANSTYLATMQFDKRLRQLLESTPAWMLPTLVDLSAKAVDPIEDLERSYNDERFRSEMVLELQRHTTLLNHHQALLLLHRGWFSQALQLDEDNSNQGEASGQSTPLVTANRRLQQEEEEKLAASISAVNESASSIIAITISAWSKYPALVIRWAFFWNAIFSAAVCRGLYVVKRPLQMSKSQTASSDLKRAIELLGHAVVGWAPLESPLAILKRLNKRAEMVLDGTNQESRPAGLGGGGEDMELIGDERRELKRKSSDGERGERGRQSLSGKRGKGEGASASSVTAAAAAAPPPPPPPPFEQQADHMETSTTPTLTDATLGESGLDPSFDLSGQVPSSGPLFANDFGLPQASLLHSSMLPSMFANHSTNAVTMDVSGFPPSASNAASASQLIQMLSSGLSWDDVSSWNDLIVDL